MSMWADLLREEMCFSRVFCQLFVSLFCGPELGVNPKVVQYLECGILNE